MGRSGLKLSRSALKRVVIDGSGLQISGIGWEWMGVSSSRWEWVGARFSATNCRTKRGLMMYVL